MHVDIMSNDNTDILKRIETFTSDSDRYKSKLIDKEKLEVFDGENKIAEVVVSKEQGVDAGLYKQEGFEEEYKNFEKSLGKFYRENLDVELVISKE